MFRTARHTKAAATTTGVVTRTRARKRLRAGGIGVDAKGMFRPASKQSAFPGSTVTAARKSLSLKDFSSGSDATLQAGGERIQEFGPRFQRKKRRAAIGGPQTTAACPEPTSKGLPRANVEGPAPSYVEGLPRALGEG